MLTFKLVFVAATSVLGAALPEPTAPGQLDLRGANCGKVNGAFVALEKLGPQGTSFCRSFVNIPATSTTVTITTPTIVTSTTSTTTVTVTSAQCPGQKRDIPASDLGYEIEYFKGGSRVVQSRANILPQLQAFGEAKISEACSCFDLRPKATTVATSTAPAPVRSPTSLPYKF
ncbi:hypothetical protein yc1106_05093 [Curvularia clavata]|uniref:Uncharacterized protein n=1 Tax=Curvularia clavata TaxID=95742 RepID=A0A9Q8Z865_CURCL|nr:hypothetical protein yc1106_05093 [Curvularia clavata]